MACRRKRAGRVNASSEGRRKLRAGAAPRATSPVPILGCGLGAVDERLPPAGRAGFIRLSTNMVGLRVETLEKRRLSDFPDVSRGTSSRARIGAPEGRMGLLDIFRRKPPIRDAAAVGDLRGRERRVPDAEGALRVLPRARRPLRQGAVPRTDVPGGGRGVALARLSARPGDRRRGGGRRAARAHRGRARRSPASLERTGARRLRPLSGPGGARQRRVARSARGACAPPSAHRPASAEARHRHSGAMGAGLFRPDADPREAARAGLSDHAELSARPTLQHPRRVREAARPAGGRGLASGQRAKRVRAWSRAGDVADRVRHGGIAICPISGAANCRWIAALRQFADRVRELPWSPTVS